MPTRKTSAAAIPVETYTPAFQARPPTFTSRQGRCVTKELLHPDAWAPVLGQPFMPQGGSTRHARRDRDRAVAPRPRGGVRPRAGLGEIPQPEGPRDLPQRRGGRTPRAVPVAGARRGAPLGPHA